MLTGLMVVAVMTAAPAPSARLLDPVETDANRLYQGWTALELRAEADRLDDLRPGIALPLIALQVGITGLGVTLFAFAIALGSCCFGPDAAAVIATGIGTTASLSLISIGALLLFRGAPERKLYTAEIERVRRLADQTEMADRMLDAWERRNRAGRPVPPAEDFIGPAPEGPPPLPLPKAPPGSVSIVIPIYVAQF